MINYIAFLRGINVSGHRLIKMNNLKLLFQNLGFISPQTYIQSGNLVFKSNINNTKEIASKIQSAIKEKYNFEVPTIVINLNDLKTILSINPFEKQKDKDKQFFHYTFLEETPNKELLNNLKVFSNNHLFEILNQCIYLYCPNGYSQHKLSNSIIENKLKMKATTRNYKTVLKMIEIAEI